MPARKRTPAVARRATPASGGGVVSTAQGDEGTVAPLPHETDQALGSAGSAPRRSMKQAHDDLERGLKDTDRAPVMDAAYRRLKK